MADHPLTDGSDQRQRRKRCPRGAQRIDKRRNPFAVAECLRVNFPHSLVIFGSFLPDLQLNTSALKVVSWSHGARLALQRSARDAINAGRNPDDSTSCNQWTERSGGQAPDPEGLIASSPGEPELNATTAQAAEYVRGLDATWVRQVEAVSDIAMFVLLWFMVGLALLRRVDGDVPVRSTMALLSGVLVAAFVILDSSEAPAFSPGTNPWHGRGQAGRRTE
jgi:hypothetical protein